MDYAEQKTIVASLESVRSLCAAVVSFASQYCDDMVFIQSIELSVAEVANNIVMHGYTGQTDASIICDMTVADGVLCLALRDTAPAFNPLEHIFNDTVDVNPMTFNMGQGINIVNQVMDKVWYEHAVGENRLIMQKKLPDSDNEVNL